MDKLTGDNIQETVFSEYYLRLTKADQDRYREKLIVHGISISDPYTIADEKWENNVGKWPPVQFGDIWTYLIHTPGIYTAESMKAYKSMDGYNFFVSGHVKAILYHAIADSPVCLVKTTVIPSQKVTDKKQWHQCWVCLDKQTGYVITAHCSCKAGAGEACSHVAAVLFKIEAAVKLDLNQQSKTSVACVWNKFYREKVKAEPLSAINFNRPRHGVTVKRTKPVEKENESDDFDEEAAMRQLKQLCPDACIFTKDDSDTDTASDDEDLPPVLTKEKTIDLADMSEELVEAECRNFLEDFNVTETQSSNLERMTRNQSESSLWKRQRVGRITASLVHDIKTLKETTNPVKLIKKIMKYEERDLSSLPSISYGLKYEKSAMKIYKKVASKEHKNLTVRDCGLFVDEVFPVFAASPDGVRNCLCHGEGLVEIKCSYKHRDVNVHNIPQIDSNFCLQGDKLELKKSHRYYSQIQFQMYVTRKTFCDFVIYTDKDIFYQVIYYDPQFVNEMIEKCTAFAFKHVVPEILSKKIKCGQLTTK